MVSVEFRNVYKQYEDGFEAVRGLNLEINDGEFLVLLGPSGCGKSTTLRMLAGLEEVTDGEILIDGVKVNHLPAGARGLGMVFQSYALYPHMSVRDNLTFGLRMVKGEHRLSDKEMNERVKETSSMLELLEHLDKKPKELSGGQRQRVALGRALIRQPKVLLMDEPLSNLDAELRHQMRTEIRRLHDELGTTTIYVTHDQIEAMTLADRVAILDQGELQQHDAPLTAYNEPANAFVKSFLCRHLDDLVETANTLLRPAKSLKED
jgi:multiple sugar transport system ATP-binding protein